MAPASSTSPAQGGRCFQEHITTSNSSSDIRSSTLLPLGVGEPRPRGNLQEEHRRVRPGILVTPERAGVDAGTKGGSWMTGGGGARDQPGRSSNFFSLLVHIKHEALSAILYTYVVLPPPIGTAGPPPTPRPTSSAPPPRSPSTTLAITTRG